MLKENLFQGIFCLAIFVAAVLIVNSPGVIAPVETTTVTFSIPSSIGHTLGYAGTCGAANFAFVEDDGTLDGTEARINVTTTDNQVCQTTAAAGMTITNNGNTNITIAANFTAALPDNVTVKVGLDEDAFETTCTGTPSASTCVEFDSTDASTAKTVTTNITSSGNQDVWWWANFTNFNEGISTSTTRTLQTNSEEAS